MSSECMHLLQVAAANKPEKIAIRTLNDSITYRQLQERVIQRADEFNQRCGQSRQIIALEGDASIRYIVSLLAIIASGNIAAPLNMRYPEQSRKSIAENLRAMRISSDGVVIESESKPAARSASLPADAALIVHTSGSSGTPKAALLSDQNLIASAEGVIEALSFTSQDRWLCPLPLWHVGGLGVLIRTLRVGASILIADSSTISDMIKHFSLTHLSLVDLQFTRILEIPELLAALKSHAKGILLGGSAISKRSIQGALDQNLPVYLSYGLTEMSSTVTMKRADGTDIERHAMSSGRILTHREMRISPDGIIEVNGPTRFLGYLKEGALESPFDAASWFRTGDRGELSDAGELFVQGRIDNLFISGGENIQPEQIEASLMTLSDVFQSMVVPLADSQYGNRPVAFVSFSDGSDFEKSSHITAHTLRSLLPGYMIPVHWLPFPKQASPEEQIKWSRAELTELARKTLSPPD